MLVKLFKNKITFIILGLLALFLIILLFFIPKKPTVPQVVEITPTPTYILRTNGVTITKITPEKTSTLKPGERQTLSIEFEKPISQDLFKIDMTQKRVTADEPPKPIPFQRELISKGRLLRIILSEPIIPLSEYSILLINRKTSEAIFETSYLSGELEPTPIKTNNLNLIPFLPYETANYRLIYNQEKNTYIFNFKYNPDSLENLESQYQKAKQDAIKFIESKGINTSTIVIEWRYS